MDDTYNKTRYLHEPQNTIKATIKHSQSWDLRVINISVGESKGKQRDE